MDDLIKLGEIMKNSYFDQIEALKLLRRIDKKNKNIPAMRKLIETTFYLRENLHNDFKSILEDKFINPSSCFYGNYKCIKKK